MKDASTGSVVFFALAVMVALAIAVAYYVDSCPAAKAVWLDAPRIEARGQVLRGMASWYSTRECRALTASGEPLRDDGMTAACWGVPFGTRLRVTHRDRSIVVRVNDRGPARRLVAAGRVIDLSRAAFARLASLERGVISVTIEEVRS